MTAALIYALAYRKADGLSLERLILIGIAVAAGINTVQIVLAIKLNPPSFQFVTTWITGKIWRGDWRFVLLLPARALTGGLLVLAADTLTRSVLQPADIPAGVVVAVVGAPYFLYLLAKSKA